MEKPEVGQILYSLNIGNRARHCEQVLTEVKVTKVGRKYFTCTEEGFRHGTEYFIDGWREKTDYSATSCLYASREAWEDEKESNDICRAIYEDFEYGHNRKELSFEKLRAIAGIINSEG